MVPIIVMSTVAGTGNFALARFSNEDQAYVQITIGVISLTAGVLTTILQFLKITENLEGYRQAYLSWGKLARIIELELTKTQLTEPGRMFIDQVMSEFDRLMEISPTLPEKVIERFKVEIDHTDPDLIVPDICGTINHTSFRSAAPSKSTADFVTAEFYAQHGRRPTPKEVSAILQSRTNGA